MFDEISVGYFRNEKNHVFVMPYSPRKVADAAVEFRSRFCQEPLFKTVQKGGEILAVFLSLLPVTEAEMRFILTEASFPDAPLIL